MSDVMKIANGPVMWVFSLLTVGIVLLQAGLVYNWTNQYNSSNNFLNKKEIGICIKTGMIVSVGPAITCIAVALTMIKSLGGPLTLMRVGIIGSAGTEMIAASLGAQLTGVTLGVDELTIQAFTSACFACAIMSSGYLILVPLLNRGIGARLQKFLIPEPGAKKSIWTTIIGKILPLVFIVFLVSQMFFAGWDCIAVMAVAFVVMYVCDHLGKRKEKMWLIEWASGFGVIAGLIVGPIVASMLY